MALLEIRDLRRSFGGLKAVDGVSLDVNQGQIKAVIGPNGAGKTTLFNIISGVLRPDAGHIVFNGGKNSRLKPFQICRSGVSRTFQNLSLFMRMTALENVMVGRHCRTRSGLMASALRIPRQRREERGLREDARRYLDFVGLGKQADHPVSDMPFGNRRMVELARALATEPRLLLLDEPASGLNTKETDDLAALIRKVRDRGVTILIVEHDMSLVMDIAEDILVLDFGKPIAEGPPDVIRNDANVISVYLGGDFYSAPD